MIAINGFTSLNYSQCFTKCIHFTSHFVLGTKEVELLFNNWASIVFRLDNANCN